MTGIRHAGAVIVAAPLAAPVWGVSVMPTGSSTVTVGRALILLAAALLAIAVLRTRPAVPRVTWLFVGLVVALWAWVVANAFAWGCGTCGGDVAGFSELVALCVLAAFVAAFDPGVRAMIVPAVFAGGVVCAVLALVGVDGFTPGTANTSAVQGRLAGTFGNPNLLGLALAFAVPAGLVARRMRPWRWAIDGGLVLIAAALALTFSRSALLSAAAGAAVVLVLLQPAGSGARRTTLAWLVGAAALAGVVYPVFDGLRRGAEAPAPDPTLRDRDASGWDATQNGMVAVAGAAMANPAAGELEVRSAAVGQGVSHGFGAAAAGSSYELRFEARVVGDRARLSFGLQDALSNQPTASATAIVSDRWQRLRVRWRPRAGTPNGRLYVWTPSYPARFAIRDVAVTARAPGGAVTRRPVELRLEGSLYDRLVTDLNAQQRRNVSSRAFAVELAFSTFTTEPLRGIGWGRFGERSDARSDYGRLPTHNDYLRFLAELGLAGALLLLAAGGVIAAAVWKGPRDELAVATIGLLVAGAVGLAFANSLVMPPVAMALALAAGVACARAGRATAAAPAVWSRWRAGGPGWRAGEAEGAWRGAGSDGLAGARLPLGAAGESRGRAGGAAAPHTLGAADESRPADGAGAPHALGSAWGAGAEGVGTSPGAGAWAPRGAVAGWAWVVAARARLRELAPLAFDALRAAAPTPAALVLPARGVSGAVRARQWLQTRTQRTLDVLRAAAPAPRAMAMPRIAPAQRLAPPIRALPVPGVALLAPPLRDPPRPRLPIPGLWPLRGRAGAAVDRLRQPPAGEPVADPRAAYRPALDGIRAIAVLAVIAYHATSGLPGGFLGVDVFFVLSGYLITAILLREQEDRGSVRLSEFWARRARRLLPAVLLLVAVCAIEVHRNADVSSWALRQSDLLATLFYYANWHFIATDQSYFATFLGASPVRHTWTLAIEEQFYVLWPLVVFVVYRLAGARRVLLTVIVAGIAASAVAMALLYDPRNPSRAYLGTDTRAHTLLVGAALAMLLQARPGLLQGPRAAAFARWAAVPLALALAAAFVFATDHGSLYYTGGALAFALVVAGVLFVVEAAPHGRPAAALSVAPMRWIGRISYGLYLWHWPMVVWLAGVFEDDPYSRAVTQIAATFAVATASFYLLEQPIRRGRFPGLGRSQKRLAIAAPLALAVLAIATVSLTTPGGEPALARQLAPVPELPCRGELAVLGRFSWCERTAGPVGAPVVAAIGDSTAQALYPGLRDAAGRRGWRYVEAAQGGCSLLPLSFVNSAAATDVARTRECAAGISRVLERVQTTYRPDVWVVADRWQVAPLLGTGGTLLSPSDPRRDELIEQALTRTLRRLTADGAQVVFLQTPPPGQPVDCVLRSPAPALCASRGYSVDDPATAQLASTVRRAVARVRGAVTVVSVDDVVCPGGSCPAAIGDTVVRYDSIHYSERFSRTLVPTVLDRARRLGATFTARR